MDLIYLEKTEAFKDLGLKSRKQLKERVKKEFTDIFKRKLKFDFEQ